MLDIAGEVRTDSWDAFLWTLTHGHTSVGWPVNTYIHQHCADTRCCLEDFSIVMTDRDKCQKRDSKGSTLSTYLDDDDDDDDGDA